MCNNKVLVCSDTGANRPIAGERMYKLFIKTGTALNPHTHAISWLTNSTPEADCLHFSMPIT